MIKKQANNIFKEFVFIIVFLIIASLHFSFINGLEKTMFDIYFPSNKEFLRPSSECTGIINPPIKCLGMPSGHVEIATIICCALYSLNYISIYVLILLIILTGLQRIVSQRHTISQTIMGFIFGIFYSCIYLSTTSSYKKIFFCLLFIFVYVNVLVFKADYLLAQKIPEWVDKEMIPSIYKKRNVPYYLKFISAFVPSFQQDRFIYMNWNELESYLDKIIEDIKKTNIHFNAVVGIKTGGAIISDYISKKLGIENYKMKVSNKKYNCNKKPENFFENYMEMYINNNEPDYMVCEGIHNEISGKNIILIDELVSSGKTMNTAISYLISKNARVIYPTTIMVSKKAKIEGQIKLHSLLTTDYMNAIWPWGYDN